MAVKLMNTIQTWIGLSSDTKPASPTYTGSRFYEYDTGRTYVWDGSAWRIMPVPIYNIQGGAYTIQDLMEEFLAMLDLARSPQSGTITCDGTVQDLYEESSDHPFVVKPLYIDFTGANAGAGEDTTLKLYVKLKSGGNYILLWESGAFLNAAVPDPLCRQLPNDTDAHNSEMVPWEIDNVYGVKWTIQQAAVGGGWNSLDWYIHDAKRGG